MLSVKRQHITIGLLIFAMLLLFAQAASAQQLTFSSSPNAPINNTTTATDSIVVGATDTIQQMYVSVNIDHSHGGDLSITLRHQPSGRSIALLNFLNGPGFAFGCGADGIFATFDDRAGTKMDNFDCSDDFEKPVRGTFRPSDPLSTFNGMSASGTWTIEVRDANIGDNGTLRSWTLTINDPNPPPIGGSPVFDDGRINNREVDRAAPVAIYCGEEGGIKVYDIVDGRGVLSVIVPQSAIRNPSNPPATNILLGEKDGNRVYQLANGQLQVNARGLPGEEQKEYIFTWSASFCPTVDTTDDVEIVSDAGELGTSPSVSLNTPIPVAVQNVNVAGLDLPGYFIVNIDNLYMRSGDGLQHTIVAVLNGGTELIPVGRDVEREWWFVQVGETRGWVRGEFLITRGDVTDVPVLEANGEIQPPRVILFDDTPVYFAPRTNSNQLCIVAGNLEYNILALNPTSEWYQIDALCNGVNIIGWVQADRGTVRNPVGLLLPVVSSVRGPAPVEVTVQVPTTSGESEQTATEPTVATSETIPGSAIANIESLNIRSGAGIEYTVIATVNGGTQMGVQGRVADFDWWFVQTGGVQGWVNADHIVLRGDFTDVPILEGVGEIQPQTFILFSEQTVYNNPTTSSLALCSLPGNVEYVLVGRTAAADWYQIQATCNGNAIVGWVEASVGAVRDAADRPIPVTG